MRRSRFRSQRLGQVLGVALALTAAACGGQGHPSVAPTTNAPPITSPPATSPSPAATALAEPGAWQRLPATPIRAPYIRASVWTGTEMLIYGRLSPENLDVAAAFNPVTNAWRKLQPGPGPKGGFEGGDNAVWTGSEMLVWGITNAAYNPATNRWRALPRSPLGGGGPSVTAWTGRQMIGWGGGCCGESSADGAAYTPATNSWQKLPSAPLPGRHAVGAWTGTEMIIAGGSDADGHVFADAAAYDPATGSWRRLPPMGAPRTGATAVWDDTEVLVVGGQGSFKRGQEKPYADGVAYNPVTNRWRRLPAMETGRVGHVAIWTGSQMLVWGGQSLRAGTPVAPPHGLSYDPAANRWSPLPVSPLRGRLGATVVWTGTAMIVWGGRSIGADCCKLFADGAAYLPGTP